MFCPKCGTELQDELTVCGNCGRALPCVTLSSTGATMATSTLELPPLTPLHRLPYKWGEFQGWSLGLVGLFSIPVAIATNGEKGLAYAIASPFLVASGYAFIRRKQYAINIVYGWVILTAITFLLSVLVTLSNGSLTPNERGESIGKVVAEMLISLLYWVLCAKYYRRRRGEFKREAHEWKVNRSFASRSSGDKNNRADTSHLKKRLVPSEFRPIKAANRNISEYKVASKLCCDEVSTPASFARNTYAPAAAQMVEYLSAAIVTCSGRKAAGKEVAASVIFKTFFDMEQSGFDPILKGIASLMNPTIQEAQETAPELTAKTFQLVTAFVLLHSGNAAMGSMGREGGQQFCSALRQYIAESNVSRFGFENEPSVVATKLLEMAVPLNDENELLNRQAFGTNDSLGSLLSELSLVARSSFQYGFVVGAKEDSPVGLTSHYIAAIRTFDFVKKYAKQSA